MLSLLPPRIKPADRKGLLAGIDKAADDLRKGMAAAVEEWNEELSARESP